MDPSSHLSSQSLISSRSLPYHNSIEASSSSPFLKLSITLQVIHHDLRKDCMHRGAWRRRRHRITLDPTGKRILSYFRHVLSGGGDGTATVPHYWINVPHFVDSVALRWRGAAQRRDRYHRHGWKLAGELMHSATAIMTTWRHERDETFSQSLVLEMDRGRLYVDAGWRCGSNKNCALHMIPWRRAGVYVYFYSREVWGQLLLIHCTLFDSSEMWDYR